MPEEVAEHHDFIHWRRQILLVSLVKKDWRKLERTTSELWEQERDWEGSGRDEVFELERASQDLIHAM